MQSPSLVALVSPARRCSCDENARPLCTKIHLHIYNRCVQSI